MSDRAPCVRCGRQLPIGEGPRVLVGFGPLEIESLILDTSDPRLQSRLLCALGTIDPEREQVLRTELSD